MASITIKNVVKRYGKGKTANQVILPDESELAKARDGPHLLEIIGLAPSEQHVLQLVGHVEMIFDGLFASTGNQHKVFYARADGFFHNILDHGFVHQGQHFLGLRLGRG